MRPRDIVNLSWEGATDSSRRAARIATFLGVEPDDVRLATVNLSGSSSRSSIPGCTCLVVDAESLAKAASSAAGALDRLVGALTGATTQVFVHGFQPTAAHEAILKRLSSEALRGVRQLSELRFDVAEHSRAFAGPFAGLTVKPTGSPSERCFIAANPEAERSALIRTGSGPFLVRTELNGASIFLSASTELAELDEPVDRQLRPLSRFSRLMPLMMFLRRALGERVWHNDHPRACFIIDDPGLTSERYGFMDYPALIASMRRSGYSVSIAFIPWNYRRSSAHVAQLFSTTGRVPSLCVHGCDHTGGEFLDTRTEVLEAQAQLAIERMRRHEELSGVPFDDVMVFPQGLFSTEGAAALKAAGYLAAVNSNPIPTTVRHGLALRDLLDVAQTRFAGFPVFGRRYPRDLAEFAFDLFLGRPALAVEHHGYFRNGYAPLESFVEGLNALQPGIEWTDLATICSRACLVRTDGGGAVRVRYYTGRFSITDPGCGGSYVLVPAVTAPGGAVTINGQPAAVERDTLAVTVTLPPGQTAKVTMTSNDRAVTGSTRRGTVVHSTKVLIRRHLSDFRDNHIDTSRLFSAIASAKRH